MSSRENAREVEEHVTVSSRESFGDGDGSVTQSENVANESDQGTTFEMDSNNVDIEYPEGGYRAWIVVVGSFFGFVADFGLSNSVGSIQTYILANQLANVPNASSKVSWIFALYTAMSYMGGIFGGIIFDEYGTKLPMALGTVLFTAGLLATANCTKVYQFVLSFGILSGLGTALCMNPLMGVVSHWFNKKRARAAGFSSLGGSIGGIIFPIMLRKLYPEVGFSWAIRILALICFSCFAISFFLIKERLSKPTKLVTNNADQSTSKQITANLLTFWAYLKNTIDFQGLKDPKFFFCVAATLLGEASLANTMTYFGSYAVAVGVDESTAYLMITIMNLSGAFGRVLPGLLADRYGPYNLSCVMIGLVGLSELVIWRAFGDNEKALWAFVVIYGFFSASVLSLTPVCLGAISPTRDFGKRYATNYLFTGIGTLVGLPIAGAIIGDGSIKHYNNYIVFTGLIAVSGDICWIVARYFIVGWKLNVRV